MKHFFGILCAFILMAGVANATTFTMTSGTSEGVLPAGISEVGGMVIDLVGTSGSRVVAQLAASSLYEGFFETNPGIIGTQTGFDASVIAALGGGIAEASVRLTVYDGDTSLGNFDWNDNTLLLNGIAFGNFSDVMTQTTNNSGTIATDTLLGFQNNRLNTGFFTNTNASTLALLYTTLAGGTIQYALDDVDPYDNYFDFTLGIDASLIDVGTGPIVNPNNPVPEPTSMFLLGTGLLGFLGVRRKTKKQ